MLYAKHKLWPRFYTNSKTKRRIITRSGMQIIEKHFSPFSKIMLETGHIPEKIDYALVFSKDGVSAVVCDCNDGIDREWIQQEKVLTHCFQQQLSLSIQKN